MRKYWSNSTFADWLRIKSGIEPQPQSATAEGWDQYEQSAKSQSPIMYWVIEHTDSIQKLIRMPLEAVQNFAYWIGNATSGGHILRSSTPIGKWADLTKKIPDGLLLSTIDFVEKECFWMEAMCNDKFYGFEIEKYVNQSYIRRKLFKVKVADTTRRTLGIKWLKFQHENMPENMKHVYPEIIAAYEFAKTRYQTFDAYEESGYNDLCIVEGNIGHKLTVTPAKRKCFEKIRELEAAFDNEVTQHCMNIVKHKDYLWT